jgi:hypothetical protein
VNWLALFDEAHPEPGASDAEIARFVRAIAQPLSEAEIGQANESQQNPFPEHDPLHATYRSFDPSAWVIPARPLPPSYLTFLRWSNGGWFRSGQREFGFFPTLDPTGSMRAMTLAYQLPECMPGALPFAFNGAGTFYLFDMRLEAVDDEYPIVCSHSGNQGWGPDECFPIARSFEAACRGSENVDELRWRR